MDKLGPGFGGWLPWSVATKRTPWASCDPCSEQESTAQTLNPWPKAKQRTTNMSPTKSRLFVSSVTRSTPSSCLQSRSCSVSSHVQKITTGPPLRWYGSWMTHDDRVVSERAQVVWELAVCAVSVNAQLDEGPYALLVWGKKREDASLTRVWAHTQHKWGSGARRATSLKKTSKVNSSAQTQDMCASSAVLFVRHVNLITRKMFVDLVHLVVGARGVCDLNLGISNIPDIFLNYFDTLWPETSQ